jgi:hypothetical protein
MQLDQCNTVEVLKKLENLLRKELNRGDEFVLADYFDYISGTSTGAIIAACGTVEHRYQAIAGHLGIHFTRAGRLVRAARMQAQDV